MTPTRRFLKDSSRAFQWLNFRWNLLRRRFKARFRDDDEARVAAAPSEAAAARDFRTLPGFPETERLLVEMDALARRHGARFHLIYCPPAEEFLQGKTPSAYDRAVRAGITDFARRAGIPLLDLAPRFRAETRAGHALKFPRDGHWSAEGHRVAAEEILASGMFAGRREPAQSADPTKP
jgi:hypothetical protein